LSCPPSSRPAAELGRFGTGGIKPLNGIWILVEDPFHDFTLYAVVVSGGVHQNSFLNLTLLISMGRTSKFFFPKSTKEGVNTGYQFRSLDCQRTFYGTFVSQIILQQILALPALKLSGMRTFISLRIDNNPL
jgi:hypothetical protein